MDEKDLIYLRTQLTRMLDLEGEEHPRWKEVEQISDQTMQYIHDHRLLDEIDYYIYKYLEDVDVRMKDDGYAVGQREQLSRRLPQLK